MAIEDDDMSSDGMQCSDHPFRNTSPGGGICPVCLQEKLGKLVTSSFSSSFFTPSTSSLRSDVIHPSNAPPAAPAPAQISSSFTPSQVQPLSHKKTRMPFRLTHKMKSSAGASTSNANVVDARNSSMVLKRSKSTVTPRSARYLSNDYTEDFSPRRRGFWSFLHLSSNGNSNKRVDINNNKVSSKQTPPPSQTVTVVESVDETDDSPNSSGTNASFGRKVCRSRSVGCGSRSFSGDFFERISTGLGDCTLRRVESQREGTKHRHSTSRMGSETIREKVRCGGLFGGFIVASSSSSTSSSSSYWTADSRPNGHPLIHGRTRSWGWTFASPMRAFTKPTTTTTTTIIKDGKRELGGGGGGGGTDSKTSNGTPPNLAAIPSLLSVRS